MPIEAKWVVICSRCSRAMNELGDPVDLKDSVSGMTWSAAGARRAAHRFGWRLCPCNEFGRFRRWHAAHAMLHEIVCPYCRAKGKASR